MMTQIKRDRNYYKNLIVFAGWALLISTLILYFGIPIYQVHLAMHPARHPIGEMSPADLDLDYEDVILLTKDNVQIQGWYIPSTNRAAVILVHAFNGNRTGTIYHAVLLAKHGYGVLLYDTRAQGESGGDLYALGWEDHLDIYAAIDYLHQRTEINPERIGVLGLSAGAKAALFAATQSDEIAAVVAEGTRWRTFDDLMLDMQPKWYIWIPTEWVSYKYAEVVSGIRNPLPLRKAVSQMPPKPLFLISAGAEVSTSQTYYDEASEPKILWIRDEAGHQIDALFDQPDEYERRVIEFFDQALLQGN